MCAGGTVGQPQLPPPGPVRVGTETEPEEPTEAKSWVIPGRRADHWASAVNKICTHGAVRMLCQVNIPVRGGKPRESTRNIVRECTGFESRRVG